ncbi:unnamed protein product [Chilo suppressalis]|uniref:FP protein C-terminal domain-containing protein n=1 Tax=Chilo suppressalis TaxID=168631 RepID=A0ABN8B2G0_CHISP|nr:unnamed protein product [Chilo suppressalis]
MKCSGCLSVITNEDSVTCSAKSSNRVLHLFCANIQKLTPQQKQCWICPDCHANAKKGGDNSNTPVRSSGNVTHRKKVTALVGISQDPTSTNTQPSGTTSLELIVSEMHLLRQDFANLQTEFGKRFDQLLLRFSDYDARLKSLEVKEKENELLKAQMAKLEDQLHRQTLSSLQSQIEIIGISETPGENPYHLTLTTANKIGIELNESDLNHVYRGGPRITEDQTEKDSVRLPRPLVVTFTRRLKRDEFLKGGKTRRTLESCDIVGAGPQRKVYINERLTYEARQLFRTARNWTRENKYKFCWVQNGTIFIRKREGREGSPPIQIRSSEDLHKLSARRDQERIRSSEDLQKLSARRDQEQAQADKSSASVVCV